ncbi:MAG: hypothetical protein EZS28_012423, partial [Streblomastix strix]
PKAVPGGKPQTPSLNQPVAQNTPVTVSTGKKLTDKEKAQQADANAAAQAAAAALKEQQEREKRKNNRLRRREEDDEQINVIERRKDYARQRRILDTCVVVRYDLLRIADEYDFICKQREENRRKIVSEIRRKQKERKAEELKKKKIEEKSKCEQDEFGKIIVDAMQKEQEAVAVEQPGKSGVSGQGDASKDDKSGQKGGAGKTAGAKGQGKTGVDSILGDSDDKDNDGQNDEYDDLVLQAQEDEIIFEKGVKNLYFRETVLLDLFKVRLELGDVKRGVVFDDLQTSHADITPLPLPPRQTQSTNQTSKDKDSKQQKNQLNIQQQLQVSTSGAIVTIQFINALSTNSIAEKDKQEKAQQQEEEKKEEIFTPALLSSAVSLRQESETQVMQNQMKKITALTPDKLISDGYYQAPGASPDRLIPGLGVGRKNFNELGWNNST